MGDAARIANVIEALPDTNRMVRTLVHAERLLALVDENPGIATSSVLESLGISKAQLTHAKRFMDSPFENPGGRTIRYDVGGIYTGQEGWYATGEAYAHLFVAHEKHVEAVVDGLADSLRRNRIKAGASDWSRLEIIAIKERVGRLNEHDQALALKAMGISKRERRVLLAELPKGTESLTRKQRRAMRGQV